MPTFTTQLPWTLNNQDAHDGTPVINRVQDNFDALVNAIGTLAAAGLAPTGLAGGDLTGSYPAPQIAAGAILNADVNAGAGIVYSKLSLTNSILNADIAAAAGIVYSKLSLTNSVVNADVAAGAAIVYSKLVLTNSVTNADIAAAAAIVYSKLNLSASIVGGDIAASLKPSGTAVAATESLRALGATASTALAGNTTLDAVTAPAADVSLNTHKITNLVAGVAGTDAVNVSQLAALAFLTPTAKTTTYSAVANDLVIATSGTFVVTSPAHGAGTRFGVFNKGTGVITVTAAAGSIFGSGSLNAGAASFTLKTGGTAVLISDGTSWYVISGGPSPSAQTFGAGASVAFAAVASNSVLVTHGLGSTPTSVSITLTGNTAISLTTPIQIYAQTFTSTQFTCFIALGAAATGTLFFDWVAIG